MIEIITVICFCLLILFFLSIRLKDNSIIDAFWGLGFVIIALISYFLQSNFSVAQTVVTLLVTAWGIRLFLLFLSKKLPYSGKEDKRYARWREKWMYFYTRSFFQVYVLQGILMFLVATPILIINFSNVSQESLLLTLFGGGIALAGLLYETIADAELKGFIVNKKSGDILTEGLRKYHRYPQYFGESVFWFGVSLIASQASLWAFVGWCVITFLVRYVSGVPLLEDRYKGQKNYEKYSKETPVFLPDYSKIRLVK